VKNLVHVEVRSAEVGDADGGAHDQDGREQPGDNEWMPPEC
jgi:hypothetical protein